ncbi:hypothetical protein FOCC_FOCC014683, partial [Frankliniella occidentalis]
MFKSSSFEIWPVFLSINELPPWLRFKKEYILLGGLWFGRGKPDSNLFLKPLFDELNLLKNGVLFNVAGFVNQILYKAGLLAGTCDAPAKACFLVLTNFNGLFGCPKCLSRGEKSERTGNVFCHLFQENLTLRTEANYLNQLDSLRGLRGNNPNHKAVMGIRGPTILKNMLISSLIRSTSLDVMHCVFLGTMKTLMTLWFTDSWKNEVYSLFERRDVVSHLLSSIKPPHCFERVPQSLDNLLRKSSVSDEDITLAQSLLDTFVKHFGRHYGKRRMAFNLHTIRHLPSVVRELGPLWTTSCFSFENLNGSLKYLVHGTQHAGLQIQNNFELLTQLPNHLNNLAPFSLKEFSLEMLSPHARLRVTERIESGICIVGSIRQNVLKNLFSEQYAKNKNAKARHLVHTFHVPHMYSRVPHIPQPIDRHSAVNRDVSIEYRTVSDSCLNLIYNVSQRCLSPRHPVDTLKLLFLYGKRQGPPVPLGTPPQGRWPLQSPSF